MTYARKLILGGISVIMGRGTIAQTYFVITIEAFYLIDNDSDRFECKQELLRQRDVTLKGLLVATMEESAPSTSAKEGRRRWSWCQQAETSVLISSGVESGKEGRFALSATAKAASTGDREPKGILYVSSSQQTRPKE